MGTREVWRSGGGSESVLLLGSQGVGGERHGVGQEIWDDAACGEHLGQERRRPGQGKGIDAPGQVDIYEFMGVPLSLKSSLDFESEPCSHALAS